MRISAWERPQYSVHCPRNSPGSSASSFHGWSRFGTASRLPFSLGTQKLWITSREVIVSATSRPAGMTRSLAVTMSSNCPSSSMS